MLEVAHLPETVMIPDTYIWGYFKIVVFNLSHNVSSSRGKLMRENAKIYAC